MGIHPKEIKTYVHLKNLYTIVLRKPFCNNQKLEMTKVSFNRWLAKQSVGTFIPLNTTQQYKGKTLDTLSNLDESSQNYAEWKKSNSKMSPVYDFMYHLYNVCI